MDKKWKIIVLGCLIVSIVLNIVLFANIYSLAGNLEEKNATKIDEKDNTIAYLENKIDELNSLIDNGSSESTEDHSQTELEKQQKLKEIANTFVTAYLEYDKDNLQERRKTLYTVADEKLVNRVAPETSENNGMQLSSDPTFTAKITKSTVFISDTNAETNKTFAIADVEYDTKSTEGETPIRTLIYMEIQPDKDGKNKIINYKYYPVN